MKKLIITGITNCMQCPYFQPYIDSHGEYGNDECIKLGDVMGNHSIEVHPECPLEDE